MSALRTRRQPQSLASDRRALRATSSEYDDNRLRVEGPPEETLPGGDPVFKWAHVGDADLSEVERAVELGSADVIGEDIFGPVMPKRADEFRCSSCFPIDHISRVASSKHRCAGRAPSLPIPLLVRRHRRRRYQPATRVVSDRSCDLVKVGRRRLGHARQMVRQDPARSSRRSGEICSTTPCYRRNRHTRPQPRNVLIYRVDPGDRNALPRDELIMRAVAQCIAW